MSGITSEAVIGFAKQGHPQAVAVLLNRVLVPKGAHVKVRHKEDILKILINFLRETELSTLVSQVQVKLDEIQPQNIDRVQIFTQQLGQRQATFLQEISLSKTGTRSSNASSLKSVDQDRSSPHTFRPRASQASSQSSTSLPASDLTKNKRASSDRYSVAEFLAQVSSSEELDILENHPIFTGSCPNCSFDYRRLEAPPLFWDCPECGWKDDLSQVIPHDQLRDTPQRQHIYQGKRLGSYLIEAGLLTASQIDVALADQQMTGVRLGEVLVRRGWIKEETVEYFMKKVIEPERSGATGNAEVYLKSSRNLLKTLIQQKNVVSSNSRKATVRQPSPQVPQKSSTQTPQNPANERETLILPDFDPVAQQQQVSERETLILPDLDLDEQDS